MLLFLLFFPANPILHHSKSDFLLLLTSQPNITCPCEPPSHFPAMGDVYKDTRVYREYERGDSSSDDERYRKTTVRRYKVPSRADRYERNDRASEHDDDARSRVSHYGRTSGDVAEHDRPRSAFESYAGSHAGFHDDRGRQQPPRDDRSYYYEKETERETFPPPPPPPPVPMAAPAQAPSAQAPVAVAERPREADRDWDRRSRFDNALYGDDAKVEQRIERREDGDYRIEKRVEEHVDDFNGCDVERYRKETEYYTPWDPPRPPAPLVIRQRAPEPQKIIVQEAAAPAPVIVQSPRQDPGVVVIREKEPQRQMMTRREPPPRPSEEEYYYRHERREIGGRNDRNYEAERYDHRRRDHDRYSDDDDYYVRRKVVRRREERSESPNHKRYLAEGALAGAGVTALLNSRRDGYGELPENRGRKVIAGAALGALGTEALRRAKSAYGDRWDQSPDRSSRLKQGLGIAAVALAAAGAAKYYQSNKIDREEAHRGRSRRRGYNSGPEYSRSRSRSVIRRTTTTSTTRKGSRRRSLSTMAKAALGTAATAGVVKHIRNRSKSRGRSSSVSSSVSSRSRSRSRSRSKSRIRRGAEIAGAALAAKAAHSVYKKRKDKKDNDSYDSSDDEYYRQRPSHSRSRSRSRSRARSIRTDRGTDRALGPVVEYGTDPLPLASKPSSRPASRGYESEAEARRRRRRRQRERSASSSASDVTRKRSRSRLRDVAAAGAAAIGIKEYKEKKEREKREQRSRERRIESERERERDREQDLGRDRGMRSRSQSHDRRGKTSWDTGDNSR